MSINDLASILKSPPTGYTKPQSTLTGTVVMVEGSLFVRLAGALEPTPATTTIAVKDGDQVQVNNINGSLVIVGNLTNPTGAGGSVGGVSSGTTGGVVTDVTLQVPGDDTLSATVSANNFDVKQGDTDILNATKERVDVGVSLHCTDIDASGDLIVGGKSSFSGDTTFSGDITFENTPSFQYGAVVEKGLVAEIIEAREIRIGEEMLIIERYRDQWLIYPHANPSLSIAITEDRIEFSGDVYINGKKVQTEEVE